MIIAQTELASPLPSSTSTGDVSINNGIGWLVPIAIGIGIVYCLWLLRRKARRSKQIASPNLVYNERSPGKLSPRVDKEIPPDRVRSDKKKKNRGSSGASQKTDVVSPQVGTKSKRKVSSERPTSNDSQSSVPSEPAIPRSVPINAIFEPLRDVGALRRSGNSERASNASKAKPKNEPVVTRPAGVKFERTITQTATTQSVANRWADSQPKIQPPKIASTTAASDSSMRAPTNAPSPSTKAFASPTISEAPAPSQGLKSFVSKVKAVAAKDSDSAVSETKSSDNPA